MITDIKKNNQSKGAIFILSNGGTYSYSEVLKMAESGKIRNVEVRKLDDGSKYLYYTNPDALMANDLYNVEKEPQ